MKTKNKYILLSMALVVMLLNSCNSFLDMTPVEQLTFDKIWEKRGSAESYLATVYGYMPKHSDANGEEQPVFGATDESSMSWPNWKVGGGRITDGGWNPASVPGWSSTPANDKTPWTRYYRAIREATIFINNIDRVPENQIDAGKRAAYKMEARFLRANYYASLMKFYGPIILIGEDLMDPTASQDELSKTRNSWDECMAYVKSEIEAITNPANLGALPLTQANVDFGRPTRGAALAVYSRLTLYGARPLFNGSEIHSSMANKDGKKLMPQSYSKEKWKIAADAAKAVIDLGVYSLHRLGGGNAFEDYAGVFEKRWNSEIILGRNGGSANMAQHNTPRGGVDGWGSAYGGWGPTQQQVDAYAMSSGIYPITGYSPSGAPKIDLKSNYVDDQWITYENPFDKNGARLNYSMYKDREPRFYVSIFWNGQKWNQPSGRDSFFHTSGNSGPPEQDHARTGYLNRKFCPRENDPKGGKFMTFSWPYYRYAEVLLNYVEALNEYHGPGHQDIKTYINDLRDRAGLPALETLYPEAFTSTEALREYILKERRLELAFEGQRYFDTRTWLMNVDGGPMYGMNVLATDSSPNGGFWKRTICETRVFRPSYYLYPIHQNELNKNLNLVQNYGW